MIRKISHITITFLLFVLTMGFTVSKHYCGGSLVDVSVFSNESKSCSGDESACSMDGCCHNEHQVYQLNEDCTSPIVVDHVNYFQFTLAEFAHKLIEEIQLCEETDLFAQAESPPPKKGTTILSNIQIYRL